MRMALIAGMVALIGLASAASGNMVFIGDDGSGVLNQDTSWAVTPYAVNTNVNADEFKTVDGSGLSADGIHDRRPWHTDPSGWMSENDARPTGATILRPEGYPGGPNPGTHSHTNGDGKNPPWIRWDFDKVYPLEYAHVWNLNEDFTNRSMNLVVIEYSTTGGTDPSEWAQLVGPGSQGEFDFDEPDPFGADPGFQIEFGGVPAKAVIFTALEAGAGIASNGGGNSGLSEIRFFYPEPGTLALLAVGGLMLGRRRR